MFESAEASAKDSWTTGETRTCARTPENIAWLRQQDHVESAENDGALDFHGVMPDGDPWRVRVVAETLDDDD